MSKSNTFENELLEHIFNNVAISDIGDASGLPAAATAGSLYIALHVGDPGEAGNQSTNEASYTGYARKAVARANTEWTVATGTISNDNVVTFDPCTGGSATVDYFSIGKEASGATEILYSGALTSSLAISNGITPEFGTGALTVTEG